MDTERLNTIAFTLMTIAIASWLVSIITGQFTFFFAGIFFYSAGFVVFLAFIFKRLSEMFEQPKRAEPTF